MNTSLNVFSGIATVAALSLLHKAGYNSDPVLFSEVACEMEWSIEKSDSAFFEGQTCWETNEELPSACPDSKFVQNWDAYHALVAS